LRLHVISGTTKQVFAASLEVIHAAPGILNARNEFLSPAASAVLVIEHKFVAIFWFHKFSFWLLVRLGPKSRLISNRNVILVVTEHVVSDLNLTRERLVKVGSKATLSSHVKVSENWLLLAARVLGLFLDCLFHDC
jgi:hypothetical protein